MHWKAGILRNVAAWLLFALWLGSAAAVERGLLWKIEPAQGAASYLFGTIHTDDPRVTEFSPELRQAMQASRQFVMEVLPSGDLSGIYLPQGSLRDLLSADEVYRVLQLADQYAMRDEMVMRMKPWLLAAVLSLPEPHSPYAQDVMLMYLAGDYGLQPDGLEAPDEHFGALDDLPLEQQLTLLRATLKLSMQDKEAGYEAVLQAYLGRDVEQILAADAQITSATIPEPLWQAVKARLLDRRNMRMAEAIARKVAQGPVFVAVGAAHLAGEGGLVARLRQAGYTVRPIQ